MKRKPPIYDPADFRRDHEVAVFTGAGAGIGRAIAETFSAAGASVMVSDLDPEAAQTVATGDEEAGGRAAGYGLQRDDRRRP